MTAGTGTGANEAKEEVRQGWTHESAGWVKHAELLSRWTGAVVERVVEGARLQRGDRVLDVACGPGTVAFAAASRVGPGGSVVGLDLIPEMVAGAEDLARRRGVANVAFEEGDAEAMPFEDASFDAVTCLHGIMFCPEAERAASEMLRVLRPGGRASVLVWGPMEENPFFGLVTGPFFARMDEPPGPPDEDAPGPFRFSAPGKLRQVIEGAGFEGVREDRLVLPWSFPGEPEAMIAAGQEISSSLYAWLREALPPEAFAEAQAEVLEGARALYDGERVVLTATVVRATGQRPPG